MTNLLELPLNLPVPKDDGACAHLESRLLPSVQLKSTSGQMLDLNKVSGMLIIYVFPMIGRPDAPPMVGWNEIPGARGCTPQSCAFRDLYADIEALGAKVFGVSTQSFEEQQEAVGRLHLPFELLSDSALEFAEALALPTFEYHNRRLIKRLTLVAEQGEIRKVFYPVFPPNENAQRVLEWLLST
jgi:peroxiredoxin